MNAKSFLVAGAALLAVSNVAVAQESGLYLRADAGYSWATDAGVNGDPTTSFFQSKVDKVGESSVFGIGVGYKLNKQIRADVSYSKRGGFKLNGDDSAAQRFTSDIDSEVVLLTGYYSFDLASVKPYLGLGFGWANNKMGNLGVSVPGTVATGPGGKKNNLAWQVVGGVDIPLTSALVLDVAYHYVDLGKLATDSGIYTVNGVVTPPAVDGGKGNLRANELTVGLRYNF
jgi:opacity protein-like surface antigen